MQSESHDSKSGRPGLILLSDIFLVPRQLLSFRDPDRHYDPPADLVHQHVKYRIGRGDSHFQQHQGPERQSTPPASTSHK